MLSKNLDTNILKIESLNQNSCDINKHFIKIKNKMVAYIFLESTSSDDKISNYLGKALSNNIKNFDDLFFKIKNTIPNSKIKIVDKYDEIFLLLASGFTIILVDCFNKAIAVETKAKLDRGIENSTGEPTLRGPRDSFIENYQTNIGLIRKRIKDNNLIFKECVVGRRTKTKVAISYIKDIADTKLVNKLINKLEKIDIDGIIDSSNLKELLMDNKTSFPKVISTERPDLVCMNLLNGKIALLVENTPYVLIIPAVFSDFFVSPDDAFLLPINSTITKILRYLAFIFSVVVPGLYIAVMTYNMEIIPNLLLISFSIQKEGVPFPTIIEVLILIVAYEILKEADTRKPHMMGASISIVGALILGDAAVTAGIISPIVVIIISISAVAGMTFSDPDIVDAIRIWRIIFMVAGCILGIIGILIVSIIFIAKLCSIESFNTPYMTPLAPFRFQDLKWVLARASQQTLKFRPFYLTKNSKRVGEK